MRLCVGVGVKEQKEKQKWKFGDSYVQWGKTLKGKVQVQLSLCWTKYHAMKTYGGVEIWFHAFLTSALVWGEWSASRPEKKE
jgi:hypothetical protein